MVNPFTFYTHHLVKIVLCSGQVNGKVVFVCLFVFFGKDSALVVMHNLYIHDCKFLFSFLLVREMLNSGINPDLVNEDGLTALHQVHMHLAPAAATSQPLFTVNTASGTNSNASSHLVLPLH